MLFALYWEIYSQQGWFPLNKINSDIILKSVSFINDSSGFAVTNKGSVLTSFDFGKSWDLLKLTETSLNDIFKVNGTCFIVGDNGKIFNTIDGITWNELISNTNETLNSVYFTDANDGYAFGSGTTILKTTDGGESWIKCTE